ncbi:MAG: dUTP diphosphatase [Clostridia bacterium]|nr:dUTP diphosphatase [Clostridia bacterium]MBQ3076642.1 dUTP diphosphatase [Clostridia bacterium]
MSTQDLPTLPVLRLTEAVPLPACATEGAAGLDLAAALSAPITLTPGGRTLVPTGVAVAIPEGYAGLLFARSGLALKKGLCLANGVGLIDCDYRGEIKVALLNTGLEPVEIAPGERIAQLMLTPFLKARPVAVEQLPETARGAGGFGSTGTAPLPAPGGDGHG